MTQTTNAVTRTFSFSILLLLCTLLSPAAHAQTTLGCDDIDNSDLRKFTLDGVSGSKTIVMDFNRCLAETAGTFASAHSAMDVTNTSEVDVYLEFGYRGPWGNRAGLHVFDQRFLVRAGQSETIELINNRRTFEDDAINSPWEAKFSGIRGLPGRHVMDWHVNYVDLNKGVNQYVVSVVWDGNTSATGEVTFSKPRGSGEWTNADLFYDQFSEANKLIDKMGQFSGKINGVEQTWPGKLSHKKELLAHAEKDLKEFRGAEFAPQFSKYGGWKHGPRLEATGFFRTTQHEGKWWLVDPEGYLFWSHGVDGAGIAGNMSIGHHTAVDTPAHRRAELFDVYYEDDDRDIFRREHAIKGGSVDAPAEVDYHTMNLIRKYGASDWRSDHEDVTLGRMKTWGLNTMGAWSMDPSPSRHPYCVFVLTRMSFAGMPDPFDERNGRFLEKLDRVLRMQARTRKNDPYLIGIFVDNEIKWNRESNITKKIMDAGDRQMPARLKMVEYFEHKYSTIENLNRAWWGANTANYFKSFNDMHGNTWKQWNDVALADLSAFDRVVAEAYYKACREKMDEYLPNHLYLGSRLHAEALENRVVVEAASKYCDVVSFNIYRNSLRTYYPTMEQDKPWIVGEWHFGTATHGVWGTGLKAATDVENQADCYEMYITEALKHPGCVGTHWFRWVDQCATGRTKNGENFRVGFINTTDQPYATLVDRVTKMSNSMYQVRSERVLGREAVH